MELAANEGMRCALCGAKADVHCAADAAFLCGACDAEVHSANFLASRHRRTRVSAPAKAEEESASSSCLSTADSATTTIMAPQRGRRMRPRRTSRAGGEVVLEGWAKRMGLTARAARRCTERALQDVAAAATRMPLRVAMAGALWQVVAAAYGGRVPDTADALRRLEACAHVPARVVVAVASSIGRARVKLAAAVDTEEGWGECS